MGPDRLSIGNLQVTVWRTAKFQPRAHANIVYLPVVEGDGQDVWERCRDISSEEFVLVCISGMDWDDALSPWECEGVFRDDAPFQGNAGETLRVFVDQVIPAVERELSIGDPIRTIAGYSLGGLFAIWSLVNCAAFQNAVSASGSLWFPGFTEYFEEHEFPLRPKSVYLSLGKKETRTPSRLLCNVADATQLVYERLSSQGVTSVFEWNPGNHFKDPALRTAKGIAWVLGQGAKDVACSSEAGSR